MTFRHPSTNTRRGEPLPPRPRAMGFQIPMPDPSLPITPGLIDYYAERAADLTRGMMAQQVVNEEGKMPGTPGQGFNNPRFRQPQVRPLNEVFETEPDEDSDDSA